MSPFGRYDVIVLALMLIYVFAVIIHVCCRYYLARHTRPDDSARRKKLGIFVSSEMRSLKSVAVTAPYLGLAGTCVGILSAFGGMAMNRGTAMAIIVTKIGLALITTAGGILVALLATCSHNYLRKNLDLLEFEVFEWGQQRGGRFRGTSRISPTKRFSQLPAFGLVAAPGLAIAIMGYMTIVTFHPPTGLYAELASAPCEYDGDRLIVLHITDAGRLFLNQEQEERNSLADRLSQIYSMRKYRTIYVLADSGVPFQTVADTLDTVENAPAMGGPQAVGMKMDKLNIKVRLVTPAVLNSSCRKPVVTGPATTL